MRHRLPAWRARGDGIDEIRTVFTRGVLIDVAGLKGVETLPDTYEITVEDLQAALERQNVQLQEGDAVLIHAGWGQLWGKDNERYNKSAPGIGVAAAEWLIEQDPILIGADNWPVEVAPSKTMPEASLPVHQIALVVNGVHLLENLKRRARRPRSKRIRLPAAADQGQGRDGLDRRARRSLLIRLAHRSRVRALGSPVEPRSR